jgi:hypothetical protein
MSDIRSRRSLRKRGARDSAESRTREGSTPPGKSQPADRKRTLHGWWHRLSQSMAMLSQSQRSTLSKKESDLMMTDDELLAVLKISLPKCTAGSQSACTQSAARTGNPLEQHSPNILAASRCQRPGTPPSPASRRFRSQDQCRGAAPTPPRTRIRSRSTARIRRCHGPRPGHPSLASEFVGERDSSALGGSPRQQRGEPGPGAQWLARN